MSSMKNKLIISEHPSLGWLDTELCLYKENYINAVKNRYNNLVENRLRFNNYYQTSSEIKKTYLVNWLRDIKIDSLISDEEKKQICQEDDISKILSTKLNSVYTYKLRYDNFKKHIESASLLTNSLERLTELYPYWLESSKKLAKNQVLGECMGAGDKRDIMYRKYSKLKNLLLDIYPLDIVKDMSLNLISSFDFSVYQVELLSDTLELYSHRSTLDTISQEFWIYSCKHFDGNTNKAYEYVTENKVYDKIIIEKLTELKLKRKIEKKAILENISQKSYNRYTEIIGVIDEIYDLIYINDYIVEKKWFLIEKHPCFCYYITTCILMETLNELGESLKIDNVLISDFQKLCSKHMGK